MKSTFGLAAVMATLFLVSGCSGLHGKDKPTRDPVRLPSASSGRERHQPGHSGHDRLATGNSTGAFGWVELIS